MKFLNRNAVLINGTKSLFVMLASEGIKEVTKDKFLYLIEESDHSDFIQEQLSESLPEILKGFISQKISDKEAIRLASICILEKHFQWSFHWFVNDLATSNIEYESI